MRTSPTSSRLTTTTTWQQMMTSMESSGDNSNNNSQPQQDDKTRLRNIQNDAKTSSSPNQTNKKKQNNNSSSSSSSNNKQRRGDGTNNKMKMVATSNRSNSSPKSVAIIGGGIAGLSCARHLLLLQQQKQRSLGGAAAGRAEVEVTVFDTGRLRPGGRASCRYPNDYMSKQQQHQQEQSSTSASAPTITTTSPSPSLSDRFTYDHAAQFITVPRRRQQDEQQDYQNQKSSSSSSSISWRSDFDQWVHELYHQHDVLQLARPDTIFNINIEYFVNSNNAASDDAAATPTSLHFDSSSLQTSYDFYYPKNGGMASLSDLLVKGGSDGDNNINKDMEVATISTTARDDDDDRNSSIVLQETTTTMKTTTPIDVRQDVWVSPSNGVKYMPTNKQWRLFAKGKRLNPTHDYDRLVIAHNGKCADRLMSSSPSKQVHRLLRVNFNDRVVRNSQKMTLNSIYSYTVCLKSPSLLSEALPKDFLAGFITTSTTKTTTTTSSATTDDDSSSTKDKNDGNTVSAPHPRIAMITNQIPGKYDLKTKDTDDDDDDDVEVWTIFSTATFAKQHKAPQEFLPDDVVSEVTDLLLESLQTDIVSTAQQQQQQRHGSSEMTQEEPLRLKDQVLDQRLQLWGAALPMNVWDCPVTNADTSTSKTTKKKKEGNEKSGFLYDSEYGVGVCGDWLMEASIAGAWTSGRRLAEHILATADLADSQPPSTTSANTVVGLEGGRFKSSSAVQKFGIGALLDVPDDEETSSDFIKSDFGGGSGRNANRRSKGKSGRRGPSFKSTGRKGDGRQIDNGGKVRGGSTTKQRERAH
jgi:NAD(P)-binding Rossmann-like domain